jgi:hypothetical protein
MTPTHPVAGTCHCGHERVVHLDGLDCIHGQAEGDTCPCTGFTVAGTWLVETLARALHEAFGDHDSEACLDGYDLEHARALIATPAGQSLAARVAALEAAVPEDPYTRSSLFCYMCGENRLNDGEHYPDCRWLAVRGGAS